MTGIQLNSDYDLLIKNGHLTLGETQEQNAQLIVCSEKGEWKEYPQLGTGITRFLKSTGREREMLREIKVQLALDGIKNPTISITDGQLKIEL